MSSENTPNVIDALASQDVEMPFLKRIKALRMVYDGLAGSPQFFDMMRKHHEASQDSSSPASELYNNINTHILSVESALDALKASAEGQEKEETWKRLNKAQKMELWKHFTDAAHDLKMLYEQSNACFAQTFSVSASSTPVFDPEASLTLGMQAQKTTDADEYKALSQATAPQNMDKIVSTLDDDGEGVSHAMGQTLARSLASSSHQRSPQAIIQRRDQVLPRMVKSMLELEGLNTLPEYERMMDDFESKGIEGLVTAKDAVYHNLCAKNFSHAREQLFPLVFDESGRRINLDRTTLDAHQMQAFEFIEAQLPQYVNFLNDLHAKMYPDSKLSKPVFDLEVIQKTAQAYVAHTNYVDAHVSTTGMRLS